MVFRSPIASEPPSGGGPGRLLPAAAVLVLALASPFAARGESLVVLNSRGDVGPYQQAVRGFKLAYRDVFFTVNLDEKQPPAAAKQADVIVAIGSTALDSAVALPSRSPVVFLMTLRPPDFESFKGRPYVGIEPLVALNEYLEFIAKKFPALTSVGIMTSDPRVAEEARAAKAPIRVDVRELRPSDSVPDVAADLLRRNACLLLRPDPRVDSRETAEAVLARCRAARKPVFAFSEALVKQGAFAALVAPYAEMGMQAARIAGKSLVYLRDRAEMVPPDHTAVYLNRRTAGDLGISVPEGLLLQAQTVE